MQSINLFMLSRERTLAQLSKEFGFSKDALSRHSRYGHAARRGNALATVSETSDRGAGTSSPASPVVAEAMQSLVSQQTHLVTKASNLLDEAEAMLARFKGTDSARDWKLAIDAMNQSIRLLGDLHGLFPKATAGPTIDNRQIHLSGLSRDDLQTLISGLRAQQSLPAPADAIDAEYTQD